MRIDLAVMNHLLAQSPEVRAELAAYAGRRVAWRVAPVSVTGVVTDDGWLAGCEGEPEATLTLRHSAVMAVMAGRDPSVNDVVLEGDAELAGALLRLSGRLSWHWVEDVSRLAGDAAAYRVERLVKRGGGIRGEIAWRLAASFAEHLREEAPLLAGKPAVAAYVGAVDELRDDTERFEKRLLLLEQALNRQTH